MSTHTLNRPHTSRFDPSLLPAGTDAVAVCSVVATVWQLDFNNPVQVVSLPVDFTVNGLPPVSFVQVSPTRVALTFGTAVATGQAWVIPQRSLHVRTATGGFVAAATGTF